MDAVPFSALIMTFTLPFKQDIKLPLLIPEPACGKNNSVINYALVKDMPDWVSLDEQNRVVALDIKDDSKLFGTNVPIEINLTYGVLV